MIAHKTPPKCPECGMYHCICPGKLRRTRHVDPG